MKLSKKDLIKLKQSLAYKIRNIKDDYSGLIPEDMPEEIIVELKDLFIEMNDIRKQLEERENA